MENSSSKTDIMSVALFRLLITATGLLSPLSVHTCPFSLGYIVLIKHWQPAVFAVRISSQTKTAMDHLKPLCLNWHLNG
jgi:hypothetical protein